MCSLRYSRFAQDLAGPMTLLFGDDEAFGKILTTLRSGGMPTLVSVNVSGSEVGSGIAPLQPEMKKMAVSDRTREPPPT